jgi:pyridoxal phosphate enzyme (YggS family)
LVAVSKTVGIAEVQRAAQAGIHDFGENRSPLFVQKQVALPEERWHFIGHIQTNKLKDLVGRASLIHSVATRHALEVISRLAVERQMRQPVLLEVNVSGEESKDGVSAQDVPSLLQAAGQLPGVEVRGLMTMAPVLLSERDDAARQCFASLRRLRDNLAPDYANADNISLNELSMGMSDDFEDAVKEGATLVRIGRRLWS